MPDGGRDLSSTMLGGGETLELGGCRCQAGERGRTYHVWSLPLGFSPPCIIIVVALSWCRADNHFRRWWVVATVVVVVDVARRGCSRQRCGTSQKVGWCDYISKSCATSASLATNSPRQPFSLSYQCGSPPSTTTNHYPPQPRQMMMITNLLVHQQR